MEHEADKGTIRGSYPGETSGGDGENKSLFGRPGQSEGEKQGVNVLALCNIWVTLKLRCRVVIGQSLREVVG